MSEFRPSDPEAAPKDLEDVRDSAHPEIGLPPKIDSHPEEIEEYAGGYIQAHIGSIPIWLLVVYAVLFVWALYYEYQYWGGVGPGRPG